MDNAGPLNSDRVDALVNATFRLNNLLLSERDHLVRDLGLTSSRWQILEAIHQRPHCATASAVARQLGLSRQGVQRVINDLEQLGMLASRQDPNDRRGHLIVLRNKGIAALIEAGKRQAEWSESLSHGEAAGVKREAAELQQVLASFLGEPAPPITKTEVPSPMMGASVAISARPARTKSKAIRAFESVQDHILAQIKSARLQPGSKLPAERELAASLGIGRSAVREALRSLEISGVLRFERGSNGGAFVREGGPDGLIASIRAMLILGRLPLTDLLEVRASLLGQCARLGTERATAADLDRLERNIDELEDRILTVEDQMASIAPATEFYRLAARSAHNPLMVMIVDAMADLVAEMLTSLHHWPRLDTAAIEARRQMVAAMRAGRADDAERVIRQHSHDTNRLLLRYEKTLNAVD